MKKYIIIAVLFWCIIGVFNFSANYAEIIWCRNHGQYLSYEQRPEDYRTDIAECVVLGIVGPFALPAVLTFTGFCQHGFLLPGRR